MLAKWGIVEKQNTMHAPVVAVSCLDGFGVACGNVGNLWTCQQMATIILKC